MSNQSFSDDLIEASRLCSVLADPGRLDILRILSEKPHVSIMEICEKSPLKEDQVKLHIQILLTSGLVSHQSELSEDFKINKVNLFSAQVFLGSLLDEWNTISTNVPD